MSEKYLGEQGLAKLIELVKKNSGGSAIYIKRRDADRKPLETSLTINTLHNFYVSVNTPMGGSINLLVQLWFTGTESYSNFSQACVSQGGELWITEVAGVVRNNIVTFFARLFYIGPDENKINRNEFKIMDVKKLE